MHSKIRKQREIGMLHLSQIDRDFLLGIFDIATKDLHWELLVLVKEMISLLNEQRGLCCDLLAQLVIDLKSEVAVDRNLGIKRVIGDRSPITVRENLAAAELAFNAYKVKVELCAVEKALLLPSKRKALLLIHLCGAKYAALRDSLN